MFIILSLLTLFLLGACSIEQSNESVDGSKTEQTSELPQPGDPDFVGPLEKEDWEKLNK